MQSHKMDTFFKRAHKYGFTNLCFTVRELFATSAADLYQKVQSPSHRLHIYPRSLLTAHEEIVTLVLCCLSANFFNIFKCSCVDWCLFNL